MLPSKLVLMLFMVAFDPSNEGFLPIGGQACGIGIEGGLACCGTACASRSGGGKGGCAASRRAAARASALLKLVILMS